jgi:hypothetical protein
MTVVKALQVYDARIDCGEGDCLAALETLSNKVAPLRPYPPDVLAGVVRVGHGIGAENLILRKK